MKVTAEDLAKDSSRVNPKFIQEFLEVFPDTDKQLVEEIGKKRKEKDRIKAALDEITRQYSNKEAEFTDDIMRKIEREVYLKVLDTLWMQHLENMQHLREGIHWRSIGQRDPLVEYRSESQKLFDGLEKNLREEVLKILLSLTRQEAHADSLTDGQEYESELTKMADSATEKGVNEISAGEKSLDKEFKDDGTKSSRPTHNYNQKRNVTKQNRKKERQNKKKGKQQ